MEQENELYFPLFVHIRDKKILMVGAGNVALRRIQTLCRFGASIRVVTREVPLKVEKEIESLYKQGKILLEKQEFAETDLTADLDMVIAATDNNQINEWIYLLCKEKGILVNVASNHELCDFFFPAIIQKDDIIIGITGNGAHHTQVAQIASNIRKYVQSDIDRELEYE